MGKESDSLDQKSYVVPSSTSVPNDENRPPGRKSARVCGEKLPSQTMKTGLWDGSQHGYAEKSFRPKHRKQALRTEGHMPLISADAFFIAKESGQEGKGTSIDL